jgi:threonine dehydratase
VSASSNPDVIAGGRRSGTESGAAAWSVTVVCGVGGGALASGLGLVASASDE